METKLQALRVTDLKALLTSAGLSVSGNKPDLIQRLLENPSATASLGGAEQETEAAATAAAAEAVPTPAATSVQALAPAAVAVEALPAASASAPAPAPVAAFVAPVASVPAQVNNGSPVEAPPQPEAEAHRQALIVELEKRKQRAAKFGQPLGEAERKLERAIKFGLDAEDQANVAKLMQPLGSRPAKPAKPTKQSSDKTTPVHTEQENKARFAQLQVDKEKAKKRAERFGLVNEARELDEEKKRKRNARDDGALTDADKKIKA